MESNMILDERSNNEGHLVPDRCPDQTLIISGYGKCPEE